MNKNNQPTIEDLAANLADSLRADPEAEKAFRADPIKFMEAALGQPLPADLRIEIHDNTDTVWHIPMGQPPGPINDAELENVAGGWRHQANFDAVYGKGNWKSVVQGSGWLARRSIVPTEAGIEHAIQKGIIPSWYKSP